MTPMAANQLVIVVAGDGKGRLTDLRAFDVARSEPAAREFHRGLCEFRGIRDHAAAWSEGARDGTQGGVAVYRVAGATLDDAKAVLSALAVTCS